MEEEIVPKSQLWDEHFERSPVTLHIEKIHGKSEREIDIIYIMSQFGDLFHSQSCLDLL